MADEKEKNTKQKKSNKSKEKEPTNKASNKKAQKKDNNKKKEIKNKKEPNKKQSSKKNTTAKHAGKEKKESKNKINNLKAKLKKQNWKKIGIISGSCLAGVYLLGAVLFSFLTFPNTIVADTDISFRTGDLAKQALIPNAGEYVFRADGFGFDFEIEGSLIDYDFDVDKVVDRVISLKKPFAWPVEVFKKHDFMEESVVSYNKEAASSFASIAIEAHNTTAEKPQNANFLCDPITKTASIKDEVIGNALKPEETLNSILAYIGTGRRHLELGDEEHLTPSLYSSDERIPAAVVQANKMLQSIITLQLATTTISTIDSNLLSQWIQLKEEYIPGLNDEVLAAWVADLANQYDTLGKRRTFTTPYGKTCTVSGGDGLGWKIDQPALIEEINKQAVLGVAVVVATPCSASMNSYAGPGARDWGARYIDVDLSEQKARMYGDAGELLWSADIVSGKPSTRTPTGIYTIKGKQSPSVLIGETDPTTGEPSYRSTVQYWMPFIGNMIGFHDASWQTEFGGDRWIEYGSHGCINLDLGTAQSLYSLCVSGDIVVVHY